MFRKHICGTSIVSISPRVPHEDNIQVLLESDAEKRYQIVEDWRKELVNADSMGIIIFRKNSDVENETDSCQNSSFLERFEADDEQTFANDALEDYRKLLFSGCEFDDVLIILESDVSIYDKRKVVECDGSTYGQTFGQNLLLATTRAKKTLKIVVKHEWEKKELDNLIRDENQLIVAQVRGNEESERKTFVDKLKRGTKEELCDVIRVSVQRQETKLFEDAFAAGAAISSSGALEDHMAELFIDAVLPGCIGRQKSQKFLRHLSDFAKRKSFKHLINSLEGDRKNKMILWVNSAYSRDAIETFEWRVQFGRPIFDTQEKAKFFREVLISAMKEGSLKVVDHAFEKASKFFDVHADDISKLIVSQSFEIDFVESQSLLSIATWTNRDHKLVEYLMRKILKYKDSANASMIAKVLQQAMAWSVQYGSFLMLRELIAEEEQHFVLLIEFLKEMNPQAPIKAPFHCKKSFIERVKNFAQSAENAKWSDDERKLLVFIQDLENRLESAELDSLG